MKIEIEIPDSVLFDKEIKDSLSFYTHNLSQEQEDFLVRGIINAYFEEKIDSEMNLAYDISNWVENLIEEDQLDEIVNEILPE